ncbi:Glycosyl transferase, group 1 [Myxococcus hansupus]|uniref:Glycosyl transferase, group 1 n=1 Tax=Pseudomyxococcus hansupus TaxID=1297742 RepID=A0A0H4X5A8_9BACT|nr:glycosyltransferase family 4 protein [Myxococcus hansupus]AKQ69023.1 Glycosyl transferase, group 1 [Myxococcus hansupus]
MSAASTGPAWHLLTGEYPPDPGGVSDHTRQVSHALARAGQEVHVWAPGEGGVHADGGVTVHRVPGLLTPRGLPALSRGLDACPGPRRLLLQYVPHALGLKAMNVPFCAWFAARQREERWVYFHEAVFPWEPRAPWLHHVLAGVTRVMARTVASNADRVFVSIPQWAAHLPGRVRPDVRWLPIPSNLPVEVTPDDVGTLRARLGAGPWLGHFGTYGRPIAEPLEAALVPLLQHDETRRALLMGRGSRAFVERVVARHPGLQGRLEARDSLSFEDLAVHLSACDVLLQPYPDGVSTRRTTVMAGLALGVPVVTNTGHLTEPLWQSLEVVALAEGTAPSALVERAESLLARAESRQALGQRAARVYRERFSLERTVETLLHPEQP